MGRVPVRAACALLGLALATAGTLQGQAPSVSSHRYEVFVNSEWETYLRALQVAGSVAAYPWSIRSFSLRELDVLGPEGAHPWQERVSISSPSEPAVGWSWLPVDVEGAFNSAFPYGRNDGAFWAGRGVTAAIGGGVAGRWGPLSAVLAPRLILTQNAGFELAPHRDTTFIFADARNFANNAVPQRIDLPQRFGDGAFTSIVPGQSSVRIDLPWIAAGLSTANQHWGPVADQPIILGNNAPGYLHTFVGTASPLDLWVARVHGRVVWGRLEHSEHAPLELSSKAIRGRARFTSALVGVVSPRGVPGLEIGAARIFHEDWPAGGPTAGNFLRPFETFLKIGLSDLAAGSDGSDASNQLASVFFRWVFPRSGLEAYGEFARNDHSWDLRDFFLQPDHNSGYALGLRKVWLSSDSRMTVVRGEILNTSIGHVHQVRTPQVPFYVHSSLPQGHTHRGQLLGASAGYGGGSALLAADLFRSAGEVLGRVAARAASGGR
jgi:hypothetical protein